MNFSRFFYLYITDFGWDILDVQKKFLISPSKVHNSHLGISNSSLDEQNRYTPHLRNSNLAKLDKNQIF